MARLRRARSSVSGFVNVRKPAGVTSHHCVAILRKIFNTTEVGHAGTLDPMATGVLVVALGRATKFLQYLMSEKEYRGVVRFGLTTSTDDITGDVLTQHAVPWLTEQIVRSRVERFVGAIDQVPPKVSALKRSGKRLYELARANEEFDVPARRVDIHSIELLDFEPGEFPEASVHVACGAGTYIRSIAREWGEAIAVPKDNMCHRGSENLDEYVGGTLVNLQRTRSGAFTLDSSHEFDQIRALHESGESPVLPVEVGLTHLPLLRLPAAGIDRWLKGGVIGFNPLDIELPTFSSPVTVPSPLVHVGSVRIYDASSSEPTFLGVSQVEQPTQPSDPFVLRKRVFTTP